ncbi:hypothetical protein OH76DRAFT_1558338 [Lentinus brumalis]|uniref:Uncharacterized protein n=1 Tax=Lentinus brumalis TaxID=2498619 RepID=A0A371D1S4_9APHY|nr:hypothetical protein OH76DRAFT_1558338 [Polyporus brumalis]
MVGGRWWLFVASTPCVSFYDLIISHFYLFNPLLALDFALRPTRQVSPYPLPYHYLRHHPLPNSLEVRASYDPYDIHAGPRLPCSEPEGFYDAVRAYGLPLSLIDLDKSAQDNVPYQVKTVHGLTEPFTLSGITQQGGPFSPLKSTLTTSMVNHWLHDSLPNDDRLYFMSRQGKLDKPHTPDDRLRLHTQMVEAMDDSILLMPSLKAVYTSALHADRFQAAYGWETNWSKSLLYATQAGELPATIAMPSVDPADPDSNAIAHYPVAVTTDFFDFLRVQINDPTAQSEKILSDFPYPPYLSYQPLTRSSSEELDCLVAQRVHEYLGFPFRFNHHLLYAPFSHLGFDFRSIARLNDAAAVQGMLRDLNHHVPAFRVMARITLADWTCMLNDCQGPLEGTVARSFARSKRTLPTAWITALDVLRELGLAVRLTDQSHLFTGDVALRHLVRGLPPPPTTPDSLVITNLERAGITHLHQVASWSYSGPGCASQGARLIPHPNLDAVLRRYSAGRDWPTVARWLGQLTLEDLTRAAAGILRGSRSRDGDHRGHHGQHDARWTLALPRKVRQDAAEWLIRAAASLSNTPPLPSDEFANIIASDASAVDRSWPFCEASKHVTFAAASTTSTLLMSISPLDRCASSLHGEILGLISATLLHLHSPQQSSSPPTLFTDHLNSVRFVDNHLTLPSDHYKPPSFTPALSLYTWLFDLLARSPTPPIISYTPAHTSSTSLPARANSFVDRLASSPDAHSLQNPPLAISLPTFTLPDYSLHSPTHGYIESGLPAFLSSRATALLASRPDIRPNLSLFRALYDAHAPPLHPYTRASSAYSAAVQLYSRSSQLDTAFTRYSRYGDCSPWCHAGCAAVETAHHVFVVCPAFDRFRQSALRDVIRDTSEQLTTAKTTPTLTEVVLRVTSALFSDSSEVWPQHTSRYYLGTMPPLQNIIRFPDTLDGRRLLTRVVQAWHLASIRLASRIWGEYKRRTSSRQPYTSPTFDVPQHLTYLLAP